jgi:hypothetical protein
MKKLTSRTSNLIVSRGEKDFGLGRIFRGWGYNCQLKSKGTEQIYFSLYFISLPSCIIFLMLRFKHYIWQKPSESLQTAV